MSSSYDLTTGSIPGHIKRLAIPASVGFLFNVMFNVVDTYFGGKISTEALAVLSLSFPVFFIILSFGHGLGTGTTALIANALGKKDEASANMFAQQSITFGLMLAIILTSVGYFIAPLLFKMLHAEGYYLQLALSYMNVILMGTVFFIMNNSLNSSLSARGDTKTFRNFLILGFFLNLILDPLLMFGYLGFPKIGIAGTALATVIIQFVGMLYMIYRLKQKKLLGKIICSNYCPYRHYFKEIAKQSLPAALNMMTIALGIFIITFYIGRFGKEAVAAYGIATRIEQIVLLPTIGLNIAALSMTGQNFGAGFMDRVKEIFHKNLLYGVGILTIGTIGVIVFSTPLMKIFTTDQQVIKIGVHYLRVAGIVFNSYVFLNISISVLQGMKFPIYAIWIGIYRQMLMPFLIFPLFSITFNWKLTGIWVGIIMINWSAAIFTYIYTKKKLAKLTYNSQYQEKKSGSENEQLETNFS